MLRFNAMNQTIFAQNRALLKQFHPTTIAHLTADCPYFLQESQGKFVLNKVHQRWEMNEVFVAPSIEKWGYLIYGLGTGKFLNDLLKFKAPKIPVLVIDSMPDVATLCLQNFDFEAVLSHPDVTYLLNQPAQLPAPLHHYLSSKRDLLEVHWQAIPWVAKVAQDRDDLFFLNVYRQYQAYLAQAPLDAQNALAQFYAKLAAPMQKVYLSHPLSCKSGCADCCKKGNGFDLLIRPLEWALMFKQIRQDLNVEEQKTLLSDIVLYLIKNATYLEKTLHYFNQHLDQLQTEAGNQAYYQLTQSLRSDPCPFLTEAEHCGIYAHRPLSCRTFGNSFFAPKQAYTCIKDRALMERIILDEKQPHQLLDGLAIMSEMQAIHTYYPYGHVMYAWLFTHLDPENQNWISDIRLDYHQFQRLVDNPTLFQTQLLGLKNWAKSLA
ncbi:MAG: YkgJ family cysteine cluster protein [Candidatus Sericytochromatia bacterium]